MAPSDTPKAQRVAAQARRVALRNDILAGQLTQEQIARKHGVSRRSVVRAAVGIRPATLDAVEKGYEAIHALIPKAIETLQACLNSADDRTRVAAANSLLDRSGIVKTERREITGPDGKELRITLTLAERESAARGTLEVVGNKPALPAEGGEDGTQG